MQNKLSILFKPPFSVYHRLLKLILIVFLVFGQGLTPLKAQMLYIKVKGGTQTNYFTSEVKNMNMTLSNLIVNLTNGSSDSYSLSDIRYINFVDLTTKSPIIGQQKTSNKLLIYPNPVTEFLNIQPNASDCKTVIMEIISTNGKIVLTKTLKNINTDYQVDVSKLPKGLYLCRLTGEKDKITTKFLKK
jgi:hypothetical protein